MGNKLYVGNLAFSVTESKLEEFFRESGISIEKAEVVRDISSGRSRGFGFVQLEAGQDLNTAIEATNGKELLGRQLTVNEARDKRGGEKRGRGGRHRSVGRY
ncbi:MAG: RNA-binding protein [Acidobacteria bacterium]|nr:RNA-binding protein [Acidobacteriota bacterium]